MLLVPFQGGLRAIDPDVQVVLVPAADLRGVEHPLCSALEPQEDVAVVVEPAAAHKRAQVRAELLDPESGDVAGEVLGVGPDVPMQPAAPLCLGSVLQTACLKPV